MYDRKLQRERERETRADSDVSITRIAEWSERIGKNIMRKRLRVRWKIVKGRYAGSCEVDNHFILRQVLTALAFVLKRRFRRCHS